MPRYRATAAISSSLSQPPLACWAANRPWITAERLRSGGNLATQWSIWARTSSDSATIGSTLRAFSKLPVAFMRMTPKAGMGNGEWGMKEHEGPKDHRQPMVPHSPFPIPAFSFPASSSIDLTKHDVVGADHRHDVGQHVALHHLVHRRQVGEPGRAQVHAERLVRPVADQVAAELALGRLDRRVGLAGRHAVALREQLEVVDQRFHVVLHLLAGRGRHLVVVEHDRAGVGLQPAHALLDDAYR